MLSHCTGACRPRLFIIFFVATWFLNIVIFLAKQSEVLSILLQPDLNLLCSVYHVTVVSESNKTL